VLGPLDAAELLRGVTAFLEQDGHWGSAASALGVYRHTVRHRIDAIERLTGRRMDWAQDRHELWLALRARDAAQMSAD
jgi:purine catabolism regulator